MLFPAPRSAFSSRTRPSSNVPDPFAVAAPADANALSVHALGALVEQVAPSTWQRWIRMANRLKVPFSVVAAALGAMYATSDASPDFTNVSLPPILTPFVREFEQFTSEYRIKLPKYGYTDVKFDQALTPPKPKPVPKPVFHRVQELIRPSNKPKKPWLYPYPLKIRVPTRIAQRTRTRTQTKTKRKKPKLKPKKICWPQRVRNKRGKFMTKLICNPLYKKYL